VGLFGGPSRLCFTFLSPFDLKIGEEGWHGSEEADGGGGEIKLSVGLRFWIVPEEKQTVGGQKKEDGDVVVWTETE
jgi:hypothetical protein